MDVDPLADTVPPRHAVESDEEEDEFNPLTSSSQSNLERTAHVKITGSLQQGQPLIHATGNAGKSWAKGANLGEQVGEVIVNEVQVGLIFRPSWTQATVLLSEITTRLPTWSMHAFADAVTHNLRPESVALLDTYPSPSYISVDHTPNGDPPVRYLSSMRSSLADSILPFAPPNLLQSTSASLLSILSIPDPTPTDCTLLLLPSPHIPSAPPQKLILGDVVDSSATPIEWPLEVMRTTHKTLISCIGEEVQQEWHTGAADAQSIHIPSRKMAREQIGEGGMYI